MILHLMVWADNHESKTSHQSHSHVEGVSHTPFSHLLSMMCSSSQFNKVETWRV